MFIKRFLLLMVTLFMATACMSVDVRLDQPLDETKNGLRLQLLAVKESAYQLEARQPDDYAKVVKRAAQRAYSWRGDAPEDVYEYIVLERRTRAQVADLNHRFERVKRDLHRLDINDTAARRHVQTQINDLRRAVQLMKSRDDLGRLYRAAQAINRL